MDEHGDEFKLKWPVGPPRWDQGTLVVKTDVLHACLSTSGQYPALWLQPSIYTRSNYDYFIAFLYKITQILKRNQQK
jgi:hypothetical protein